MRFKARLKPMIKRSQSLFIRNPLRDLYGEQERLDICESLNGEQFKVDEIPHNPHPNPDIWWKRRKM